MNCNCSLFLLEGVPRKCGPFESLPLPYVYVYKHFYPYIYICLYNLNLNFCECNGSELLFCRSFLGDTRFSMLLTTKLDLIDIHILLYIFI